MRVRGRKPPNASRSMAGTPKRFIQKRIRASLLARPETALKVKTGKTSWTLQVPSTAVDPIATVIAIDVDGMPALR